MYQLAHCRTKIKIDLDNGLYTFYPEAGIGKSRLCALIREYMSDRDLDAYAVTYADICRGENVREEIARRRPRLIMFDRYNLYKREYTDVIREYKDSAIILVDYKGIEDVFDGMDDGQCSIRSMTVDSIEID